MAGAIRVEGLREYQRELRKLGDKALPAQLRITNLAAAERVAARSRATAPVGSGRDPHPGRLRDSIRSRATARGASVRAGGARVPYALPIHWGWKARNIEKRPFMFEALDEERRAIVAQYERDIDRLLDLVRARRH